MITVDEYNLIRQGQDALTAIRIIENMPGSVPERMALIAILRTIWKKCDTETIQCVEDEL